MFNSARIKLTLWYMLIASVITLVFSAAIYGFLAREIERFEETQRIRIYRDVPFPLSSVVDPILIDETRRRILIALGVVDSGVIVLSGILGFSLAGRILTPIKVMIDDQNRFVSDASHELRTPLASLKTAMEVYLRNRTNDTRSSRELIVESLDQVNRLQYLSDSLLQLARFKKPELAIRKVVLNETVQNAIARVAPAAKKKKIKIVVLMPEIRLKAIAEQLTELFVNLIDNAIKYSPNKTTITVAAKKLTGQVEIKISDEGMGIAKADLPHIFDRFYRADASRSEGGYGLGLAIAKGIVEAHQGTITVDSKIGHGTTFVVRLPREMPTDIQRIFRLESYTNTRPNQD